MTNLINFTLFGSGIAFGIMLLLFIILLFVSDSNENGYIALFSLIVIIGLNYFWGTFPLNSLFNLRNILIYIFLGFIYSIIRTYFKGKELNNKQKESFNLKEHVFRWWFLFPICFINWLFGSLLKDLFNKVYNKLSSVYNSIFNL